MSLSTMNSELPTITSYIHILDSPALATTVQYKVFDLVSIERFSGWSFLEEGCMVSSLMFSGGRMVPSKGLDVSTSIYIYIYIYPSRCYIEL